MTNDQIIKEFREKFIGECPPYHDGITHESFPAEWTKKMLDIKELESFILQVRTDTINEIRNWIDENNDWVEWGVDDEKKVVLLEDIKTFLDKLDK
jgi:hypothetical protein